MRKVVPTEAITEPKQVPNLFDLKYTPTVLQRYPKTNYSPEEPFPAYAAMVIPKTSQKENIIFKTFISFAFLEIFRFIVVICLH
jgi:hypothetical protein